MSHLTPDYNSVGKLIYFVHSKTFDGDSDLPTRKGKHSGCP